MKSHGGKVQRKDKSQNMKVIKHKIYKLNTTEKK